MRNSDLGFALAFPFSATSQTVTGFETFGDNQFVTAITAFPNLRNQQKYQFRYDVSHSTGDHSFKFGVNFIHEPVLGGSFPGNQETLYTFPNDPTFYTLNATNPAHFRLTWRAEPKQRRRAMATSHRTCSASRCMRRTHGASSRI